MSDAEAFADAAAIKTAGFDLVRTAHYPPTRAFLAAAEELGLALWVDLPWYRAASSDRSAFSREFRLKM